MKYPVRAVFKALILLCLLSGCILSAAAADLILSDAPVAARTARERVGQGAKPVETHAWASRASRTRTVAIDRSALVALSLVSQAGSNETLRLRFFDDVAFDITITRSERTASGGLVLTGRVAGDPTSSAVLVDNDGVVHVAIASGEKYYSLQGTPAIGYVSAQMPPTPQVRGNDVVKPPSLAPTTARTASSAGQGVAAKTLKAGAPLEGARTLSDDGSTIDIMVAYTPAARAAYGGTSLIEAAIDAQVALTNQIYANSNVVQRLRLVYKGEFEFTEGDVFADLVTVDTNVPTLSSIRSFTGADVVSVWGVWPQVCGVSFGGFTEQASNSYYATHIVQAPACTGPGGLAMAHELGHTMGLHHDPATDSDVSTLLTPEGGGPLTEVFYAAGYVDSVNRFRTVMSYDSCATRFLYPCKLIPYFSNPLLSWDNSSYYNHAAVAPLGNVNTANESQALNDTRETIANYQPARTPPAGGLVAMISNPFQTPLSAGSLQLRIGRFAGTSGAVTVSYAISATDENLHQIPSVHFATTNGTLTWADGDNSVKTLTIPYLLVGQLPDQEDLSLVLTVVSGAAEVGHANATTIQYLAFIVGSGHDPYPPGGTMPLGFISPGSGASAAANAWSVDYAVGYQSPSSLGSAAELAQPPEGQSASPVPGGSDLQYTGAFTAGTISFRHLVSGIAATAALEFSIDGMVVFSQAGGQTTWGLASMPVTAGTHTIRWRYSNTGMVACAQSTPGCQDRAWIDDVSLPLSTEPQSHYAWLADVFANKMFVVDPASKVIVSAFTVGNGPIGIAAHPDGTKVYVSNNLDNTVSVMSALSYSVTNTVTVGAGPIGIAINPAGTRLYVVNKDATTISVVDTATNARLTDIAYAGGGTGIDIDSTGTRAYVALGDRVQPIDLTNGVALTPIALCAGSTAGGDADWPLGIAVSNDGGKVYVGCNGVNSVAVVDTASGTMTASIATTDRPTGIAVNPRGPYLYINMAAGISSPPNYFYSTLAVVDTNTNNIVATPGIGQWPVGVAVNMEGTMAVVSDRFGQTITVVDTVSRTSGPSNDAFILGKPRSFGKFIAPVSIPGIPQSLAGQVGDASATLSFLAPANNGGLAITRYDATCQPGNITATAAASPITVPLSNGVSYTCSITATNNRGTGGATAPVAVRPAGGTVFTSATGTTFTAFSPGSFSVTTSGTAVAGYSTTGPLPNGVTLGSDGTLSGTPASGTVGSYTFTITAGFAIQSFTLTVIKHNQAIAFTTVPVEQLIASGAFPVAATGGGSGNTVTFSSLTASICNVSGANVTPIAPGTCTIAANQTGNGDYNAAPQVTLNFTIATTQAITFPALPASVGISGSVTMGAFSTNGSISIVYTSLTPSICTISGPVLTGVAFGTCTVQADQPGNTFYHAASSVTRSTNIVQGAQTLTVAGGPLVRNVPTDVIQGRGASGNPVVVTTTTSSVCSISGTIVTGLHGGLCQLNATQAGNANFTPASKTWTVLIDVVLQSANDGIPAVVLNDGRVLVVNGASVSARTAELYDPVTLTWAFTGSTINQRQGASLTLLANGKALLAGGNNVNAELYDPATGTWSSGGATPSMQIFATATPLGPAYGNKVLLVGGYGTGSNGTNTAIYDPATNSWSAGPPMVQPRVNHATTLLPDGRVLVLGGAPSINNPASVATAEVYDPAANSWSSFPSMTAARQYHTATALADGRVLVLGGYVNTATPFPEIYTPGPGGTPGTWGGTGGGTSWRYRHTATKLLDGRVLMVGGTDMSNTLSIKTTSLYNPTTNNWLDSAQILTYTWTATGHSAPLLQDGTVLVISNGHSEVYGADLQLPPMPIPAIGLGNSISTPLNRVGGGAPFNYSLSSGTLPPGLTLTADSGIVAGTTTAPGSYDFSVTVTDVASVTVTQSYHIDVGYVVTLQTNGTVTPTPASAYLAGATPAFTLAANGQMVASTGGTCTGTLSGNVFTLDPLATHCTLILNRVVGVPTAPTISTVLAGDAQATVFLSSAPASNGGGVITSYLATSNPEGHTNSCTMPCTSVVVTGLTNGTAYTFTLAAVNSAGTGAASSASTSVTPKGVQTITFGATPSVVVGGTGTVTATGGASGNPIVFTSNTPTTCSLSGNVITGVAAGNCRVFANQAGNSVYNAATQKILNFTVAGLRTITPSVANGGVGGTINPSAPVTAANGATRVFTVSPNSGYSASVSGTCGGTLVGTTFTTSPITADCTVIATFVLASFAPDAPVIGVATAGNHQATVSFTAGNDGGSPITGYTASCGAFSAGGAASPLTVTGLTNGTSYNCSVTATNAIGTSPASATVAVTPTSGIVLSSVVSRKTHGAFGDFDIVLDTTQGIAGAVTVEPRMIGAGHRIVFQFDRAVESVSSAFVQVGPGGNFDPVTTSISGSTVTVTLTGIADVSRVNISLSGVNGTLAASASVGFLVGDVNNSRSVNASDISGVKARSGEDANSGNFKYDLNASGSINTSDISAVKARSGNTL